MCKGHWYDVVGKERTDLRAMSFDFDSFKMAVGDAMDVLPDTRLIVINKNLDLSFIAIEESKRKSFVRTRKPLCYAY